MTMVLSDIDQRAVKDSSIEFVKGRGASATNQKIELQFPPHIVVDGKMGIWLVKDTFSWEPLAIWKGAKSRKITLELEYVVHGFSNWSADRIAENVRQLKGYFYEAGGGVLDSPAFKLSIYGIVPSTDLTWRCNGVNIRYSPEMVDNGWGLVWPLHTKASLSLETYSNVEARKGSPAEGTKLQNIKHLSSKPKLEWY